MRYSQQLRQLRRARQRVKRQQLRLVALELEGLVVLTLHSATRSLTVSIERATGAQVVDALQEALRDRQRALGTEARQLRQDWQESEALRARQAPPGHPYSPAGETPS